MWVVWSLISDHLEIVLVSVQDRCTVCVKRTMSSKIVLDTIEEHLDDIGHVESHFNPFRDSVSIVQDRCMLFDKRTIGSEILFDAPDGTRRG
jgi:hypothetical protein